MYRLSKIISEMTCHIEGSTYINMKILIPLRNKQY
jgi:hypothetical protein